MLWFYKRRRKNGMSSTVTQNDFKQNVEVGKEEYMNNEKKNIIARNLEWSKVTANSKIPVKVVGYDIPTVSDSNNKFSVLDAALWSNRVNSIYNAIDSSVTRDYSKYCGKPISVKVEFYMTEETAHNDHQPDVNINDKQDNKGTDEKDSCIEVRAPRWKFDDIFVNEKTLDIIDRTLTIAKFRKKLFDEWNLGTGDGESRAIVLNFHGPSGTGKSLTGEAIAGELGKKVYAVNYSELESKYVGDTPKNIKKVFEKAQKEDAVLIFDEADSFLGKRLTNVTQSADYGVNITRSVMLIELEKYNGIVIFTTNLEKNYDEAFKRRILADIAFELPDNTEREAIWDIYLKRGMPLDDVISSKLFADKYPGISGADIKDITLYASVSALRRDEDTPCLTIDDFDQAYDVILKRKSSGNEDITVTHERISQEQYLEETNGSTSETNTGVSSDL